MGEGTNSGRAFFFLGTLNKVDKFSALWPGEKKKKFGDKSKIASTVLVSYPHCLCIVIEGDNNMRNERKKENQFP